jgi:hypothetical protein
LTDELCSSAQHTLTQHCCCYALPLHAAQIRSLRAATAPAPVGGSMIRSALQACLGELRSAQRRDHRSIRSSSSSSSSSSGDAATAAVAAATKELLLNAAAQPSQYLLAQFFMRPVTSLARQRSVLFFQFLRELNKYTCTCCNCVKPASFSSSSFMYHYSLA